MYNIQSENLTPKKKFHSNTKWQSFSWRLGLLKNFVKALNKNGADLNINLSLHFVAMKLALYKLLQNPNESYRENADTQEQQAGHLDYRKHE